MLLDPRTGRHHDRLHHTGAFGAHGQAIDGAPTRDLAGIGRERLAQWYIDRFKQLFDAVAGVRRGSAQGQGVGRLRRFLRRPCRINLCAQSRRRITLTIERGVDAGVFEQMFRLVFAGLSAFGTCGGKTRPRFRQF